MRRGWGATAGLNCQALVSLRERHVHAEGSVESPRAVEGIFILRGLGVKRSEGMRP